MAYSIVSKRGDGFYTEEVVEKDGFLYFSTFDKQNRELKHCLAKDELIRMTELPDGWIRGKSHKKKIVNESDLKDIDLNDVRNLTAE